MTSLLRTRPVRLAATTALALGALLMSAGPASAEGAGIRFVAHGDGYDGMYTATTPARSAGFDILQVGDTEVGVYCLQMNTPMDLEGTFTYAPLTGADTPARRAAAWLAVNHATVGTPAADPNDEAAATQLAVWHYTDGIAIELATTPRQTVVDRGNELIAAAAGKSLTSGPVGASLTVTAVETAAGQAAVEVVVNDTTGAPYAGQTVSISAPGSAPTTAVSDASGRATATVPAPAGATVTVSWSGVAPAGSLLVPDTAGKQIVVADTPAPVSAQATAVVAAAPTPPPAPEPGPGPAPTPAPAAPTAPPAQLPYTGSWLGPDQLIVGLVLLTTAGAVVITMHRRRVV
jgi:TQXA domain-containing protein